MFIISCIIQNHWNNAYLFYITFIFDICQQKMARVMDMNVMQVLQLILLQNKIVPNGGMNEHTQLNNPQPRTYVQNSVCHQKKCEVYSYWLYL